MKVAVLPVFLLLSMVAIPSLVAAVPSCTFRSACEANEVLIYGLTGSTNAHASSSSSVTNLCCTTDKVLNFGTACTRSEGSAVTFLELSSASNAHAGVPASSSYSTNLCINAQKTFLWVAYGSSCSPVAGYNNALCLGSYSSSTNAHLGDCNAYLSKVCLSTAFDYAAPAVTVTIDPTSPTPGQTFTLTATATDTGDDVLYAGVRSLTVTFDGSPCATETWVTPTASRSLSCSLSRPLMGAYAAEVTATDFFGNSRTETTSIMVIPDEPYDSILVLSKENDGTADPADGDRQVFAFLSHTGSYLTSCELNWGDNTVDTLVPETTTSSHLFAVPADGIKHVQYRCYDQYRGFDPTPALQTIVVDTSPPTVAVPEFVSASAAGITVVPAPVFSSNRTPLIRGIVTEQENGALIGSVEYQLVNVTLPGTRIILIPFTPAPTANPLPSRSFSYEFSVPPAFLTDGTYEVEVRATHQGGLTGTAALAATLDTQPPTGSITINAGAPATNSPFVTLSTTFDDSRSGVVAGCRFKNAGDAYGPLEPCVSPKLFTLSAGEGTKTVFLQVTDRAGNTMEASDTIMVDNTVPAVAVTGAPANFTNQTVPAGVACSDALAGCDTTSFVVATFFGDPGQCPADYDDYGDSAPMLIGDFAFVCAAAKDLAGNIGFSSPTVFLVDNTPPFAGILSFPAAYTNKTSFTVAFWGGTEDGTDSGDVAMLDVEYNATAAGYPGNSFTPFLTSFPSRSRTFGPTRPNLLPTVDCDLATDPTQCVEDGQTYRFRARARDFAGNLGDFSGPSLMTVDRTPPACQFLQPDGSPLSPFNREQFTLRWAVTDPTSGVAGFSFSFTNGTGPHPLTSICTGVSGPVGSASCRGEVNTIYTFSCAATDNTGNTISTQATTTLIDIAGAAFLDPLPLYASNASSLWNDAARTIRLDWTWLEMGQDIQCFNVQYANETIPYTDLLIGGTTCIPPAITTTAFGPLPENSTYRFRVRVLDAAGNPEPFSDILLHQQVNTTVDSRPPTLNLTITDNTKAKLDLSTTTFITADMDNITIVANATDATTNLTSHTFLIDTGTVTQRACTLLGRSSSCPVITLPTDDDFTLRVEATDSAGNQNATRKFQFIRHPVAGFVARQRYLSIGETAELAITVRNLQNVPATVTLLLCRQAPGLLQTQTAENSCPPNAYVAFAATTDNPTTQTLTLSAQSEQTITVRVAASSVGSSTLSLFSSSYTGIGDSTTDSDRIVLDVGFPPEFPDMAGWSAALLLIVSVVLYTGFDARKNRGYISSDY